MPRQPADAPRSEEARGALLRAADVAALLQVHPKQVYRLLKRGLPARRVGSEWRFDKDEVLVWSGASPRPEPGGSAAAALSSGTGTAPSLVAGNGDLVLMALLRLSVAEGPPLLGFVQADTGSSLELLARGAVLAAGAHAGGFPTHVAGDRAARIHLVRREIGLVARGDAPALKIAQLGKRTLASRPSSAGVRKHLDEALRTAKLDPETVHKRSLILTSHLEVVLAVGAGRADVGLASRAWAERAGLAFHFLAEESYGLIVKASDLGDARIIRLCEVAQGRAFRSEVGALAGYDVEGAGDIRYDA